MRVEHGDVLRYQMQRRYESLCQFCVLGPVLSRYCYLPPGFDGDGRSGAQLEEDSGSHAFARVTISGEMGQVSASFEWCKRSIE